MLDAIESNAKGNNNFATKVISAENVEKKNVEEVRRKNQLISYYLFTRRLV